MQGKAATLAMMGPMIAATQGDFERALACLHESLAILQRLRSPDAATVQRILTRIQQMADA